ncbi:extracellular solute-binding protein [Enterococcus sp. AZ103]|uniref:extracellular solute-binding protein n=1 Tax=Enterococcus sp. AZ103 TaxID=2774628 RepID=UPI003F24BF33
MKKWVAMIGFFGLLIGLSSCGQRNQTYEPEIKTDAKEVKLKVWVDLNQGDYYRSVVDDFKKAHPEKKYDITVIESESGRAQEYLQKDPESAADIFVTPHDRLGQMVESGAVYQLTKYTDEIKQENTPTSVQAATYQDKIYGFPTTSESMFMYYDKRVFSEEEVQNFNDITTKGKIGINLEEAGADFRETPWFMSNGSSLYGENGEDPYGTTFNSPEGVETLTWIANLQKNKNVVPVNADEINALRSGKINAVLSGVWNTEAIEEVLGKNMGVAAYPSADLGNGEVPLYAFQQCNIFCINAFTQYPLDAMALTNYLTSEKVQVKAFEELGKVPSNQMARKNEAVANDPVAEAVIEMTTEEHSVLMPKIPEMNVFWQHMNSLLVDAYKGKIPQTDFPKSLDKLVDEITPEKE